MSATTGDLASTHGHGEESYLTAKSGIASWLLTVDHKRIGIMYLGAILSFFMIGGLIALAFRLELATAQPDLFSGNVYNRLFTLHGAIMVFLVLVPSIPASLGNFVLPLMLGAKDVAFQMAGSKGQRAAFEQGGTQLLEPIMELEIVVPTESMGDVLGDITGRRGRVLGMDQRGRNTVIQAQAPLVEVQRYAPELKGMTGGKGSFTMALSSYEAVPAHMVDRIVHASPFKRDDEE